MFGSKKRKKNRRLLEIDASLSKITRGQGGQGAKRRALLKEKAELDGTAEAARKKKADKLAARKERIARDNERNKRRGSAFSNRSTSTSTKSSKSKSKSKATMTGKERAQQMARDRIAAKKAGTYKKPKTAQELAKERLEKKNKSTKKRGRVR